MPIEIVVPRLGWSMETGIFAGWLIDPGTEVRSGDMLFQLEGEKALQEVESFDAGVLCVPQDAPQSGDQVSVGQVLGYLLEEGEEAPASIGLTESELPSALAKGPSEAPYSNRVPSQVSAGPAARRFAREMGISIDEVAMKTGSQRISSEDVRQFASSQPPLLAPASSSAKRRRATPRARRAARQAGIALDGISGTGRGGRIRERDVLAVQSNRPVAPCGSPSENLSSQRSQIASKMMAGVQQTAPVTLHRKVRADQLIQFYRELKQSPLEGVSPTINELIMRLTCQALMEHPKLNGTFVDDRHHQSDSVELSFGVDTPGGLLAPVISEAESLALDQLCARGRELIDKARSGRLSLDEMTGGTFTVTNLGSLGIDTFTPILNVPQIAILGVGRALQEPVVEAEEIVVGWTMSLSLTFDHRPLDGADAARFLGTLSTMIELPARWLFRDR